MNLVAVVFILEVLSFTIYFVRGFNYYGSSSVKLDRNFHPCGSCNVRRMRPLQFEAALQTAGHKSLLRVMIFSDSSLSKVVS
jgi:hypothetical protein